MIRSAKMKAITPPKLIPPFQSTAASGTFPTEQTKLIIATIGPISGPQNFASSRVVDEEEALPERVRHPGRERARDEQPDRRCRARSPPSPSRSSRAIAVNPCGVRSRCDQRPAPSADMSISAWPSIEPTRPLFGLRRAPRRRAAALQEPPEDDGEEHDHQRPADELAERRTPSRAGAPITIAELDHEVRRGELERHRRGEVGALAEERAGQRDRGVRAGRRRRAERRSRPRASSAVVRAAAAASPSSRPTAWTTPTARTRGSAPRGSPRVIPKGTRARRRSPPRCRRRRSPGAREAADGGEQLGRLLLRLVLVAGCERAATQCVTWSSRISSASDSSAVLTAEICVRMSMQ